MKKTSIVLCGLIACAFAGPLAAGPVAVSASASFIGLTHTWEFTYQAGAPDLYLRQISINLGPTDVRFDTAAGGFGSLGFQDVGGFAGTDVVTGLNPGYLQGSGLDGGSLLVLTFANFALGDIFTFSADVDHPNPTLLTLQNCSGLGPVAKAICNAANLTKTAANTGLLLAADTVLSSQLSNALVTFQFGGSGYSTGTATAPLQAASVRSIVTGLLNGDGAGAFASSTVIATDVVPEPATWGTGIAGLALLGLSARRRLRAS